jgi:hypothetical protein
MKTIVVILVTALVSFGGTFWLVSHYKNTQFNKERAALGSAATKSSITISTNSPATHAAVPPSGSSTNKSVEGTVAARLILTKLTKLKPSYGTSRSLIVRQIIHQFESLVDLGYDALPAIKDFLSRFEEVDYSADNARPPDLSGSDSERGPGGLTPGWARGRVQSDILLPPSLRLGLVEVLKTIDGPEAQKILAEMLSTTGRGVEVAYTAKALQEMAPDRYREPALTAAKDLLNNPPKIERPNRLDENSKGYLFEVLAMYNDHSFVGNFQAQLVTPRGQLDQTALDYMSKALNEQAVPAVYQAYKDQRLTNQWDRAALVNVALNYVGSHPDANNMFADVVTNTVLPVSMRTLAIQNVLGTSRTRNRDESEAQAANQHLLTLFETIRAHVSDEQVARSLDDGIQLLDRRIKGNDTNSTLQVDQP